MVTAAFKLKRQSIDAFYKPDIDRMYTVINEEFSDKPKQPNKVVPVWEKSKFLSFYLHSVRIVVIIPVHYLLDVFI